MAPRMKTALIVDPDIGFGFWLGRGFDQARYQAFPAKSVSEATALLNEIRLEVDLLIVNPALPEAAELVESLRRSNPQLRVIALIGDQAQFPALAARVDLCCRKPDHTDVKRREWIAHVEELLPVNLFGAAFESSALLRKCAGVLTEHAQRKQEATAAAPPAPSPILPWTEWQGRTIDRHFRLERLLGETGHSAVFLTRYGTEAQQAVVKVVRTDPSGREVLLPRWERAAGLSHPGLVRLFGMGTCTSEGTDLAYLVMEYAEENLAEVLRERALTADEARDMLDPVLDALAYVHGHGLVHGRVKPSNILAAVDQLKISSDCLHPVGKRVAGRANRGIYDPPEGAEVDSPAGDVWSLGVTLVEALTRHPPLPREARNAEPVIPVTLPPLFLEIAHQCLHPDPKKRETVDHLAQRLHEPAPAKPISAGEVQTSSFRVWRYAIPAVALGLGLSGMLVAPVNWPATHITPPPPRPVHPAPIVPAAAVPIPPPAPAPPHARRVKEQVLPEISEKARDTIRGTLQVKIRAHVDAAGAVIDAKLDAPGPSRYFANRALAAAQRWKFDSLANPNADPEEWILTFDYKQEGAEAHAERVAGQ